MDALDQALKAAQQRGLVFPGFTQAGFPIPDVLAEDAPAFAEALENGQGGIVIRGLPADRHTEDERSILDHSLGLHMGMLVTQHERGDLLLGGVTHVGDLNKKATRAARPMPTGLPTPTCRSWWAWRASVSCCSFG